ncbi:MAG: DUF4928 family protein [Caldilinea sp.]
MTTLSNRLTAFQRENNFYGKGPISVALHVTRYAKEHGLPLNPEDLLTTKNGQVKGLGGARIRRILHEHGVFRPFASEAGRTSRGSIDNMRVYCNFLNDIFHENPTNLDSIEDWWVARVIDYFASQPLHLEYDASLSFETMIVRLFEQVENRQREMPGSTIVGTVLQHLVGAKLELVLGGEGKLILQHFAASVADTVSGRNGDFEVEDTVIHVTTAPAEALMHKCRQNLQASYRPIVVTLFDQVSMARGNANTVGIRSRIEIIPIEQFLTMNLYERSKFKQLNQRETLTRLISMYNLIIDECETDPSLKISLG